MVLKEGIQKKKEIKGRIVRDEIKRQVDNVSLIIKDLLARKVAELRNQNPEGKQREEEQTADQGQLYTHVMESMDSLKTELLNSPSTETVRQVRIMLNDVQKKFKGLPTSTVKAILDAIYNFIPFIKVRKFAAGEYKNDANNYSHSKEKGAEVRRLIRDMLIKFTHDNAIRYLGADIYPESYEEAKKYFDIEKKEDNVKDELHNHREGKLGRREKAKLDNEAKQVQYETEITDAKADKKRKSKLEENKRDALVQVYKYFFNPTNFNVLLDTIQNNRTAIDVLKSEGVDTRDLEALNHSDDYDNTVHNNLNMIIQDVNAGNAVNDILVRINALSVRERRAIKKYLLTNANDKSKVYRYLSHTKLPAPADIKELTDLMKVSTDAENVYEIADRINTA